MTNGGSCSSFTMEDSKCTPIPIIVARNIQKFFSGKLQNGRPNAELDVPTLLQDIDVILEGRSLEDGNLLLRGMVADLLKEVDLLRFRLDETTQSLQRVKEERDIVNHDYRDRLLALTLALSSHDADTARNIQQKCRGGTVLTPHEATTLTIQTLTKKIESLNVKVGTQEEQLILRRERIDDLESDNAAKVLKIEALERQIKENLKNLDNRVVEPAKSPTSVVVGSCPLASGCMHSAPKPLGTWKPTPKSFVPVTSPTSTSVAAASTGTQEESNHADTSSKKKSVGTWPPTPTSFVPTNASPIEKTTFSTKKNPPKKSLRAPVKLVKPKLVKVVDIAGTS